MVEKLFLLTCIHGDWGVTPVPNTTEALHEFAKYPDVPQRYIVQARPLKITFDEFTGEVLHYELANARNGTPTVCHACDHPNAVYYAEADIVRCPRCGVHDVTTDAPEPFVSRQ